MIAGLEWEVAAVCVLVVYAGASVQSAVGIGLGMMAAPVLALADSAFIPVVLVMSVLPMSLLVAWGDRRHVERRGVGIAVIGRLPGVVVGALVAASLSDDLLSFLVAVSVLVAVATSIGGRRFEPTDGHLGVAGFASGLFGTMTGVGGPPMALTYQHTDPVVMRASLAAFFAVGAVMSLVALGAAGEIGTRQWQLAALVLPGVLLGVATARRWQHLLAPQVVRPTVLAICTLSSLALLLRVLA